jgi:serine/threonine protein kinase/tetratricopeptide (TPR) repeat protein
MQGKDVGPYRVLDEIGGGGMGTVYRAEVVGRVADLEPGDVVALKVVHPHLLRTQGYFKRFLREGEIGKRVRHPNVVATLDLDGIQIGDETVLYMAMEYVEGQTLWDLSQEIGPAPEEFCLHVGRAIADGLDAIHALGVVHRDLKPENVIVARSAAANGVARDLSETTQEHVVKIMDLGVARIAGGADRLSTAGMFVGSALYASPEQFIGAEEDVDARSDLHALGLVLYEFATGTHPYDAPDAAQIMRRLLDETPRPPSELNARLTPFFDEVLRVLLAKERGDRFQSARELADVLRDGEKSEWWRARAKLARLRADKPRRPVRETPETPLVGRDGELTRLAAEWERVKAGEGRVVLVEGDAGVGKTRLVDEFVARLDESGEPPHYLRGGFPPGGAAAGSSAFAAAFRGFFGDEELEELLKPRLAQTPFLVDAFAALLRGEPTPPDAEPLTRESMETVFVHVLRSIAAERPTVFFCEDLHAAPEQGLALFAALALAVPGHRLMVVGAARPGLSEAWTCEIAGLAHARRIALARLGLKDLARLLVLAVGSARLADEIGNQVVAKSGGNPYFVFEILKSLREQGVLARDASGAWTATRPVVDIAIPSSLRDIARARVASLAEEERDVLEPAACCGFEFDPRLVGDAMQIDRVFMLKALAKIERSHRLVHSLGDRCVFDNEEVRAALREGVPDALQREYHAAIAETIEARETAAAATRGPDAPPDGAVAVELTDHFLAAGLGGRAMRYAESAVEHLDRASAADHAADLAARVLASPDAATGGDRVRLLLAQGDRLDLLGRSADERVVLEEAQRLADASGDPKARARTRIGLARLSRNLALYDMARAFADEALSIASAAGDEDAEATSVGLLGDLAFERGMTDEARQRYEREIELRRAAGDHNREASATGRLGGVLRRLGRYEEAYSLIVRGLALNRGTASRLGKAVGKRHLGSVLFALGRYEEARTHFARSLALSRLVGYRRGESAALVDMGEACLVLGDPETASRHFHAAMRLCVETGARYVQGRALHGLAARSAAGTNPGKAFRRAKRVLRLRRQIGDRAGLAESLLLVGRLRTMAGAVKAARAAFAEALDIARELDLPGERVLAAAHLAALPGGDVAAACAEFAERERRLEIGDRMEARLALYHASGDVAHVLEARKLLDHVVRHASPERRDAVIADVPLHRSVATAAAGPGVRS